MKYYRVLTHCRFDSPSNWGVRTQMYAKRKNAETCAEVLRKSSYNLYDKVKVETIEIEKEDA